MVGYLSQASIGNKNRHSSQMLFLNISGRQQHKSRAEYHITCSKWKECIEALYGKRPAPTTACSSDMNLRVVDNSSQLAEFWPVCVTHVMQSSGQILPTAAWWSFFLRPAHQRDIGQHK